MKLKFKATLALVRASPYVLKLKLTDKNPSPRSLTYPLFVTVKAASLPSVQPTTTDGGQPSAQNQTQANSTSQPPKGNATSSHNNTGSSSSFTSNNTKPARSITEAEAQGAQIKIGKGFIRIMKANQYGELKIVVRGDFLTDSMVMAVMDSDFSATIATQSMTKIPLIIKDRDKSAGTFIIKLQFENPEKISAMNNFDTIEIKTTRELTVSSGLRRILGPQQDLVKILTIPSGQVQRKELPQQLSQLQMNIYCLQEVKFKFLLKIF